MQGLDAGNGPSRRRKPDNKVGESLEAVASGDAGGFVELFVQFAPKVKNYLARQGVSQAQAEELSQETMLTVWRKADRFRPEGGNGSAWIFRIARNLRIDALRRERRLDHMSDLALDDLPPPTPEECCLLLERARRAEEAVKDLSPVQIDVLRRALLRSGALADVAADLGIPLSTAKSHLRRAIAQLRTKLE